MKQVGHLDNLELMTVSKNQIEAIPHTLSNLAELNDLLNLTSLESEGSHDPLTNDIGCGTCGASRQPRYDDGEQEPDCVDRVPEQARFGRFKCV